MGDFPSVLPLIRLFPRPLFAGNGLLGNHLLFNYPIQVLVNGFEFLSEQGLFDL